jgi:hypothetical protein
MARQKQCVEKAALPSFQERRTFCGLGGGASCEPTVFGEGLARGAGQAGGEFKLKKAFVPPRAVVSNALVRLLATGRSNVRNWKARTCADEFTFAKDQLLATGKTMRTIAVIASLFFLVSTAFGQQTERQTVIVGPWSIATTYKADKFENCTMARSASGLGIIFVRNQDGLLLTLDSTKWKLERGKAYSVRLAAGSQTVDAKALAETKGVTIAFADHSFNETLRTANFLEVRGEGAYASGAPG